MIGNFNLAVLGQTFPALAGSIAPGEMCMNWTSKAALATGAPHNIIFLDIKHVLQVSFEQWRGRLLWIRCQAPRHDCNLGIIMQCVDISIRVVDSWRKSNIWHQAALSSRIGKSDWESISADTHVLVSTRAAGNRAFGVC